MQKLGGTASLSEIYAALAKTPKALANTNWQAKIRQTVQLDSEFERVGVGVWRLAASKRN